MASVASVANSMIQALVDESDPEEPARANLEQLQRVLFNLITNAIRHTPREGTITVGAEARGDLVEVEVTDDGEIRMLDLKHLETLREVARRGSFAAAAEAISLAPSAVSQQMANLEQEVGAVLFERSQRGNRLSEAGRALAARAEAILAAVADAEAELEAISDRRSGSLRFGSFTSATAHFAAGAVELLERRYPGIEVSFADGEPYESARLLKGRALDLAVVFSLSSWPVGRDYEGVTVCPEAELEMVPLLEDPYLLILARDHPLASMPRLELEALAGETVLGGPPWRPDLATACQAAGVDVHFDASFRATGFGAFQAFVAAGRGLTLMPRLALGWLRTDVVARPLRGAPVRRVSGAILRDSYTTPATRAMLEILGEVVDGLPSYPY